MLKQNGILAFMLLVEQAMLQVVFCAICYLYLVSDGYVMLLYESVETEFLRAVVVVPIWLSLLLFRVQVGYLLEVFNIIYLYRVWHMKETALALRTCRVIIRPLTRIAAYEAAYPSGVMYGTVDINMLIAKYHTQ